MEALSGSELQNYETTLSSPYNLHKFVHGLFKHDNHQHSLICMDCPSLCFLGCQGTERCQYNIFLIWNIGESMHNVMCLPVPVCLMWVGSGMRDGNGFSVSMMSPPSFL